MVSDSPVRRVSGKGDTGCDLDGFLIIFIKKCSFELFTWQNCAFRNKDKQQRHPDHVAQHINWSKPNDSLGVHGWFSQLSLPEELSKKLSNSLGPECYNYTSFKSNISAIKCTQLSICFNTFWWDFAPVSIAGRRRQWHPTPVLLPGKSRGWRSLMGCSPWGG